MHRSSVAAAVKLLFCVLWEGGDINRLQNGEVSLDTANKQHVT